MTTVDVLKALAVTVELTGSEVSEAAARQLAVDLDEFPPQQVMGALKRLRFDGAKVTLGNIIARLEDGRPGVEEAFAMMPRNEADTTVMTVEMSRAFGACRHAIEDGDMVSARMTFKEVYGKAISEAREKHAPPAWFVSLGHDVMGREGPLLEAARLGRITPDKLLEFIPTERHEQALRAIGVTAHPVIEFMKQPQTHSPIALIKKHDDSFSDKL